MAEPGVKLETIGRYEVMGQLAVGGMAEILLGRLTGPSGFERPVVIKRILQQHSGNHSFRDMFLDEARIATQIAHPNVVQHFEFGQDKGALYLAMEYLEGEALSSVQRRALSRGVETGSARSATCSCVCGRRRNSATCHRPRSTKTSRSPS